MEFKTSNSLPDWEGFDAYDDIASNLSCVLNEDEPWESYGSIVEK